VLRCCNGNVHLWELGGSYSCLSHREFVHPPATPAAGSAENAIHRDLDLPIGRMCSVRPLIGELQVTREPRRSRADNIRSPRSVRGPRGHRPNVHSDDSKVRRPSRICLTIPPSGSSASCEQTVQLPFTATLNQDAVTLIAVNFDRIVPGHEGPSIRRVAPGSEARTRGVAPTPQSAGLALIEPDSAGSCFKAALLQGSCQSCVP
jgi:hypothetical protein